jgi:tetratricopeptide (TPR) repeat protein
MRIQTALCSFAALLALSVAGPSRASDAEDLMLAGRIAEALPVAQAEAEAAPGDMDAQERYIDGLLSMGLLGAADATYRARVEAVPSAQSWYLFGRVLVEADEAERAYRIALQSDPEHARSYMGLGAVYRATGRPEEAIDAYDRSLALDPTLSESYSGLVQLHAGLGNNEAARDVAERAIRAIPSDPEGSLMKAILSPESALDTLRTGATAASNDPRIHAALAEQWLDRTNGAEARTSALRALDISESFADPALSLLFAEEMIRGVLDADGYHQLLATRLIEDENIFAAITTYDGLVEQYPESALPLMSRARLKARQGNIDAAITDLANAIGNDSANIEAQAALGLLLLQTGRLAEAISVLGQVVRARPGDTRLTIALAQSQDSGGEKQAALATMERLRGLRPLHVETALLTAKLQAETGDSEKAYETLITVARDIPDERLVLALAAASTDVGRTQDAARWLDRLAMTSGNAAYSELAEKLRAAQ